MKNIDAFDRVLSSYSHKAGFWYINGTKDTIMRVASVNVLAAAVKLVVCNSNSM